MDDPAIADALYLARQAYGGGGMAPGYTAQTAPSDIAPIYDYLAPDPRAEYGTILPVARDKETGEKRWAMPSALREGALGIMDLLAGTKTGELTDRAAESITLGGLGAGAGLAPRGAIAAGGARPIRAYHGSPHDFDRFDINKIGTGEGAQAYGHGLYFAENEDVARGYRDTLARKFAKVNWDGSTITTPSEWSAMTRALEDSGDWRSAKLANHYANLGGTTDYRLKQLTDWYRDQPEMMAALDRMRQRINVAPEQGKMYEVAIHADPQRFLDWDKPLVEQGAQVQRAANTLLDSGWNNGDWNPTGGMLVGPHRGVEAERRAHLLKDAGIPGIKYLDQGSRGAGDGSRNYVTFDDSIIEILRKYGLMAPAPVGVPDRPVESQAYAGGGVVDRALALVM